MLLESKRCCEEDRKCESEIFGPALNWYYEQSEADCQIAEPAGNNDLAVCKTIKQDKPIQCCKCVFSSMAIAMVRMIAGSKTTSAESAEGRKYAGHSSPPVSRSRHPIRSILVLPCTMLELVWCKQ